MSRNNTRKLFNIDIESRRHYPKDRVLVPAIAGITPYNVVRMYKREPQRIHAGTAFRLVRA